MSRRGRSYVRHHVDAGSGDAMVQRSEMHSREVRMAIQPLTRTTMVEACADQMGSLAELLQGRTLFTVKGTGPFPAPEEILRSCSCPTGA